MKRNLITFAIAAAVIAGIAFAVVSNTQPQGVLKLDDFEGELVQGKTVDAGAGNGSTVVVTAERDVVRVADTQALKIVYDAVDGGHIWIARGYGLDVEGAAQWNRAPDRIPWEKFAALRITLKGEGAGTRIAVDIKDAGGEVFRFMLKDESAAWRHVTCPFADFSPRIDWQPKDADGNGVLDFPIMSYQFEPIAISKGTLFIDTIGLETKERQVDLP